MAGAAPALVEVGKLRFVMPFVLSHHFTDATPEWLSWNDETPHSFAPTPFVLGAVRFRRRMDGFLTRATPPFL